MTQSLYTTTAKYAVPATLIIQYKTDHQLPLVYDNKIDIVRTTLDIDGVTHRHNKTHHRTRSVAIRFSKPLYTEISAGSV